MLAGVVISTTFIGVFMGEAVTVIDGRVEGGMEEAGGDVGGRLLSGDVLSGLVMDARVTRACTVDAVTASDVEEEVVVMVAGDSTEADSDF